MNSLRTSLVIAAVAAALAAAPAQAQETTAEGEAGSWWTWPEMPTQQELSEQSQEAMQSMIESMRPMLAEVEKAYADLPGYAPPEVLPNGDILIRRIPPASEAVDAPTDGDAQADDAPQ